ncbi:alpha/beta fold hydrolase BchO [Thalassococcus sp. S3]|uniref:alpha/beta fold hydrolase BchO n=1 Tax=Thalassococcus sp. S3 TaxID=2017482 RepID=UPI0010247E3D|nr:alpha/beta fold hydrolase BchO [Thalassococcus sp. S3]QBF34150.1 magnesium chelatase [Thalassococcus sp. S3]
MRWPPPADWPLLEHSRQILCRPHRWHVQEMGQGETLLLLHGTGCSVHSFRGLAPILAQSHRVISLDLPGQGLTQLGARHRSGLHATTEDIANLCAQEGWQPAAIIGHSAGGAVALNLTHRLVSPRGQAPRVIGINPALENFKGMASVMFPAMAKMLALTPFTAEMVSRTSDSPERVAALIRSTGSDLDPIGLQLYRRLIRDRDHVDGTLLMMASWSLNHLRQELPKLAMPALFLTGARDRTVPPASPARAAARMPDCRTVTLPDLGHLAHEEAPDRVAALIQGFLADQPLS